MAKKFLNKVPVGTILKVLFISLLLIAGITGIVISYANPVKWVEPHLSNCIDYYLWTGCWIDSALLYTNNIVVPLNANWISTLSVSIVLLLLAVLQPEIRRGIRSFPRKVLSAYKKVCSWRDWLFAKIEYLNGESAKWKRTFNVLKSPYTLLRAFGLSPQVAISLLAVGSTAGTGVIVNETVLAERSFSNGDSGVYLAPLDTPSYFDDKDNTLRINLGAVPVREITIENVSAGTVYSGDEAGAKASVLPSTCGSNGSTLCTEAVLISGNPTVTGDNAFTGTRLQIGTFVIEKSRCKSMDFSDIDAHTIVIEHNASDGQSITQTSGNARNRAIGGGHHQAEAMVTSGGTYDRIWIDAPNSGVNGKIGTLTLSNLWTKGGSCTFKNMDIGVLKIRQNEVGHDANLATKEFQVGTTVTGANWTVTDNVELVFSEPDLDKGNE
tara:strand:+ start:428 stop:1744 length:1317 start_codon:yes stop_codon:yes gene_type:complete